MGQLLSHPLTEKTIVYNDYKNFSKSLEASNRHQRNSTDDNFKYNSARYFNCIGSMQGYRLTQEDSHLIINENRRDIDHLVFVQFYNPFKDRMENLKLSIFGVFDGHGSDECSKFISGQNIWQNKNASYNNGKKNKKNKFVDDKNSYDYDSEEGPPVSDLYKHGLAKWIRYSFENHTYGTEGVSITGRKTSRDFKTLDGLISQILRDSFILQDQELHKFFSRSSSGSTGIVAIIINEKTLYVANCGDSRCILASKASCTKTMSFDHKPQHIGELLRINDNGGTVSLGRVGGVLALSRAFGDFQFKRNIVYNKSTPVQVLQDINGGDRLGKNDLNKLSNVGTPPQESQVTVEPDILIHKLNYSKDEFLVLACDGIWDIYSNKQLVNFIKYHLTLGMKLDSIMTKMLDHGIAQANSDTGIGFDNMTAIVVVLNKPGETLSDWYAKMKARLEREKGIV